MILDPKVLGGYLQSHMTQRILLVLSFFFSIYILVLENTVPTPRPNTEEPEKLVSGNLVKEVTEIVLGSIKSAHKPAPVLLELKAIKLAYNVTFIESRFLKEKNN